MNEIFIPVLGIPAAQGSKKHVGRGILIESSKKVAPWRQDEDMQLWNITKMNRYVEQLQ